MFGVIVKSTISSYEQPGHGYVGGYSSTSYDELIKFTTEADLIKWVKDNSLRKFEVIKYEPVEIETQVVVKVKPSVRELQSEAASDVTKLFFTNKGLR